MGKTTVIEPSINFALTSREKQLIAKQVERVDLQIYELRKQSQFTDNLFKTLPGFINEEKEFQKQQRPLQLQRQRLELEGLKQQQGFVNIQKQVIQRQLADLERGGQVDPETALLIDELTSEQRQIGFANIDQRTEGALDIITDQLAASKGFRTTDSPIQDRVDMVGKQAIQERASLISQLDSDAAAAKLNIPLQQQQLTTSLANSLTGFIDSGSRFYSGLNNANTANRAGNLSMIGNLGLGLSQNSSNPGEVALALQNTRIGRGGINKTETRDGFNAKVASGIIGATGGALQAGQSLFFNKSIDPNDPVVSPLADAAQKLGKFQ